MSDSDKQALIDGSATVQTEIVVHNENLFDINSTNTTSNCNVSITDNIMTIAQSGSYPYVEYSMPNLANGETYTISFDYTKPEDGQISVRIYDNTTLTYNVPNFATPTSGNKFLTFTANENTKIRFYGRATSGTNTDNVTYSNIRLEEGTPISLTETNSVIDWNHEDFRLVKEEGWIGQFVARQVTGNLHNLSDDFSITDKELELKLEVRVNDDTTWYSLGNFLVTKVTDDEVNDKTSFEALDYTKKFNKTFTDRLNYPVTALELTQDVCNQCGVALGSAAFKNSDYVIEGNVFTNNESCRDVMKAIGKLAFSWIRIDWDNKVYIDFNPLPFKNQFDKENTSWYRNDKYTFSDTTNTSTTRIRTNSFPIEGGKTYTISGIPSGTSLIIINEFEEYGGTRTSYVYPTNNSFTLEQNTKYIHLRFGGTDFTDETNELMKNADIVLKEEPSQYETFGNNKYYNLKTQKEVFGPVDKVVIGYSAIEGERTFIGEENGTCVINVLDNPLVFNQEQRAAIIESASDLLGFTYTPLNTLTVGHPWLKGNEIVRVTDMESVSHDTIPFDRTIQYFGHIKTLINSTTETKTNDNLSYKPEMVKNYERSEIYNDQINKQIGIIINEQTDTSNRLNETISTLDGTIQRVSNTETSINDIITTTQVSTGKNSLYLEDAIEGNALSYSVDGATEQDGTPTPDNPVEVKTIPSIINYFDYKQTPPFTSTNTSTQIIDNGVRVYLTDTGSYKFAVYKVFDATNMVGKEFTLSLNSNKSGNNNYQVNIIMCDENGGNRTAIHSLANIQNITKTFTIPTISGTSKYLAVSLYASGSASGSSGDYIDYTNIMVSESTGEYVPYGYYSKVKVTGKNLFNFDYFTHTGGGLTSTIDGTNLKVVNTASSTSKNLTYDIVNTFPPGTYAFSLDHSITAKILLRFYDNNGGTIRTTTIDTGSTSSTVTLDGTEKKYRLILNPVNGTTYDIDVNLQFELGQATTYEPYKENQVLIDMSKENLCPSTNVELGRYNVNTGEKETATTAYRNNDFVPTKPNQIYTFDTDNRKTNLLFRWFYYDNNKTLLSTDTSSTGNFTTPNDCYYVNWHSTALKDSYPNDIPNTAIYEGNNPTPYYELCKIGDYKDTLSIDSSGNVVVNKNVGKVVFNGSESWNKASTTLSDRFTISNFKPNNNVDILGYCNYFNASDSFTTIGNIALNGNQLVANFSTYNTTTLAQFKTWLSTHNTDVYYVLATPETINLPNTQIPLFEGINHVTFVDDLETDTSITYYRNTPLSGTYATVTQLNEVSTEKTQEIIQVRNEVQTEITSTQASIQVINETIENGVSKVNGTGYTFDSEGLKIEKTNQDVKSLLDNDGLAVSYKGTDLLTVRSNGIEAENMTVRKFYVQRPIRMEKTKSISDGSSVGLGFFYVGEED